MPHLWCTAHIGITISTPFLNWMFPILTSFPQVLSNNVTGGYNRIFSSIAASKYSNLLVVSWSITSLLSSKTNPPILKINHSCFQSVFWIASPLRVWAKSGKCNRSNTLKISSIYYTWKVVFQKKLKEIRRREFNYV